MGHTEPELMDYSIEKLRFYFHQHSAIALREMASEQLSTMHAVHIAAACLIDSKAVSHFNKQERILRGIINGENQTPIEQQEAIDLVKRKLLGPAAEPDPTS